MYTYDQAIPLLIQNFPWIREIYENNIDDYEGLPYVLYESVFTKDIVNMISLSRERELKHYFDFIEKMMANGDEMIRNLIGVAVIESLYFEDAFKKSHINLNKFFGPLTEKSFKDCIS